MRHTHAHKLTVTAATTSTLTHVQLSNCNKSAQNEMNIKCDNFTFMHSDEDAENDLLSTILFCLKLSLSLQRMTHTTVMSYDVTIYLPCIQRQAIAPILF